ncbi:predicted protein [Naegleria gruberi]|uniref:Predicted protein n=1 Tax=Naegleria gruberi TaxID=5762 RepID=D2W367_NAEGR|nr:uncharacterized protein NAEGRDRAFT_75838 [Naegleria gruberi]EFC36466.1 predicted protein [Naegleria gruberi]|eukprot:XP_002669210.1 predicted protein [Naegleria gruberi strain NEG-M]
MSKSIQHKLMIGELTSIFESIFGSTSGGHHGHGNKQNNRKQVELEFETYGDEGSIQVRFEKMKGGKTEKRYKLIINYPVERIGEFKLTINKYCIEKKQLIILIEDFNLDKSVSLFVGKATESKIYMIRLGDELLHLSIAKVVEKLFVPRAIDKSVTSEGCIVYNPNIFFVDEPSLSMKTTCDTAMGMFDPKEKYSNTDPVIHQVQIRYREFHQIWVKGFVFTTGFSPVVPILDGRNNDTYEEASCGYCFKNGLYKTKRNEGYENFDCYEFEECVEFNKGHLRNYNFQKGILLEFIYVRGKVKKGSKSICTLTNWKRLCIKGKNPYWISKYTLTK